MLRRFRNRKIFYSQVMGWVLALSLVFGFGQGPGRAQEMAPMHPEYMQNPDYQAYLVFFKEVYKTVVENYFNPIDEQNLYKFLYVFNTRLYPEFKMSGATEKFIKWRSAAYLVEALRASDDIFSAFYPPREAQKYEQEALGKKVDLGIEGRLTSDGYEVTQLEPRADAYEKGLRVRDILVKIDSQAVLALTAEKIQELLVPLEGAEVRLEYLEQKQKSLRKIMVVSKEYFKQTVFTVPVDVPGIHCLQIPKFNQMTSEDLTTAMRDVLADQSRRGLILDLRGNHGGPPLAAMEISGFFLPPQDPFAYFQKRGQPPGALRVPELPAEYHYDGDLVILVDQGSGSSSELFSGILQRKGRAVLMGKNTAGQVFLKSMFNLSDGSMLLLVTGRGHHPDGEVFSFSGLVPDQPVADDNVDLVQYAVDYLLEKKDSSPSGGDAG
jgi:C-terminal peptidase prc